MAEQTLQSALDVSKLEKLPEVAPYYDKVHQRAYFGRWSGYVSGFLMAGLVGAAIGVIAAFLPVAVGVTGAGIPTLAAIGKSAALFASLGSTIGTTICTLVGAAAGAVSAGFEEYERRQKLEKLREKNPELAAQIEDAIHAKALADQPPTTAGQWVDLAKRAFNWKLVSFGMLVGAATGAMFAVNSEFAGQSMASFLGGAATQSQIMMAASAIGAMVGGPFFGLRGSLISNGFANAFRPVISGKAFDEPEVPSPVVQELAALAKAEELAPRDDKYFRRGVDKSRELAQGDCSKTLH